jgi:nucleoside-diphosphate-sugar epimerase
MRPVAWGIDRAARLRGADNETNPGVVAYLSRTGTYSIAKARRVLGYEPAVTLEDGMSRTEAWLRDQGMLEAAG